jgi:hypothetical protein
MATSRSKYFYPPRPGNGAGTFSDNIVGLQTVDAGGLTLGNFDFQTTITEKVNRKFNVGAFSQLISLENLGIDDMTQSRAIQATQFRVYPNYDLSQVLNFTLYGSLAKRFSVSVTKIINYFPASIDVQFETSDFTTGLTATNVVYDPVLDETFFEVPVDRFFNPFAIDYSENAATNISAREIIQSPLRNLTDTYLKYCISIAGFTFPIISFTPTNSLNSGNIEIYVSGAPFGTTATTSEDNYQIRPNDFTVDKVFSEDFDEVEKFLLNRLIVPEYTAFFQIPQQNEDGQFYTESVQVTWPKDGPWNLNIRGTAFENYLTQLQDIAVNLDSFKTNLISRFLVTDSLKEFDTLGQKVEKVFQIYGRSFDQVKQFIDALAYMNSVNYNVGNDIPSQLLKNLSETLGWQSNFSPITDEDFLTSVFGNQNRTNFPGYARAQTPTELNYQYYRNLILNSAYLFKSKGTRRSIEFLMMLIGAPESLIEYNEHIYLADQRIDLQRFDTQWAQISGGTYVTETPSYIPGATFKIRGKTFTAFTSTSEFESVNVRLSDYPIDIEGYPKAPPNTETFFFQLGAGWYETTPQHRSPDEVVITGNVYTGQNFDIQSQLQPFTYGQQYLDRYRDFPYMMEGFKLRKVVDNKKSWLYDDDKIRVSRDANYNAYYYVDNEKLVLNVKNIDLFLNPAQGLVYDVWVQSKKYNYPFPETGLTVNYPVPGGVDSTFINPEPKKKTFFEFNQVFWENMINARNRQFITDGKTGGYPTLQSIFWKYIQQYQEIGKQNNQYTYQKLIDYVVGIGPYWMKLVEQMVPATTIWNGGLRYENSVLNRQKFVYRRQRGCEIIPVPVEPCEVNSGMFAANVSEEVLKFSVYPWYNGDISVSNFNTILASAINSAIAEIGVERTACSLDSVISTWYVDLRIGGDIIIQQAYYTGYGSNDVPTDDDWTNALLQYLPNLYNYGYTFYIEDDTISIMSVTSSPNFVNVPFDLNSGINISINCES